MAIIDGGSNTANRANVDSNYNLQVNTPLLASGAGFITIAAEVDAGSQTGRRVVRPFDASWDSRLRVGVDIPIFIDKFAGSAQNTALYRYAFTTMTATQANGWLTLNANNSTAAGNYCLFRTWRSFQTLPTFGTTYVCYAQMSQLPVANSTLEWGLGIVPEGTGSPTDGVFFRYNSAGEFRAIITSNSTGSYQETTALISNVSTVVGQNLTHQFRIGIQADVANFWIDGILVASLARPVGGDFTSISGNMPAFFRNYVLGGVATVPQIMRVSTLAIIQQDINATKAWPDIQCGMGMHGSQGQTGGTMGSTATYVNSTNAVSGAATNTAIVVGTSATLGLGGNFHIAGTALAASVNDVIISSYPNVAGTAAIPGRTLYIHGVRIGAVNLGATVATTPTTISLVANYGHTAVTLATAESASFATATAKSARRIPLGIISWPVGAVAGSTPTNGDIYMPFTAPLPVAPGEFFAISGKFLAGTATVNQTIYFLIGVDSYWE